MRVFLSPPESWAKGLLGPGLQSPTEDVDAEVSATPHPRGGGTAAGRPPVPGPGLFLCLLVAALATSCTPASWEASRPVRVGPRAAPTQRPRPPRPPLWKQGALTLTAPPAWAPVPAAPASVGTPWSEPLTPRPAPGLLRLMCAYTQAHTYLHKLTLTYACRLLLTPF